MNIKKHLIITGNSNVSWKDAIVKAIDETSKTIDYLSEVKILEQRATIQDNKTVTLPESILELLKIIPGDKLILYTDGLTEGKNVNGEEFGVERIQNVIEKYSDSSIDTLCKIIINDNLEFTEGNEASDDICLLGIQFDN